MMETVCWLQQCTVNDSMTMGRYGKRYQPKVLLEALMKLDYKIT